MAVFLLIRHGHNDSVGKTITGRTPGVRLNQRGSEQAERLADRLSRVPLTAVFCSPLERTLETAAPIARRHGLQVEVREALQEIDFGAWAGRRFEELEEIPLWRQFNTFRSGTRIPEGELMVEVQARMVAEIERLRLQHPDGILALVSHGDPIKAAIAHYAGFPLDLMLRFEVGLASVSILAISDWGPRILCINQTDELPL